MKVMILIAFFIAWRIVLNDSINSQTVVQNDAGKIRQNGGN